MTRFSSMKERLFGSRAKRDSWWLVLFCVLVYSISEDLDFFERLHYFSRDHEDWNLDEYFSVAMFLPFACMAFIGRRYHELQREVEMRRQAEEAVRRLAHFDYLTGLPNRNLLEDRLAQAIARARRRRSKLAVLFIDLDGFKAVNDTHGHAVGDELLRTIAQRIRKQVREPDTAVRLGGDEFLVLLDEVGASSHIGDIAQRLIVEIGLPFDISGNSIAVSASIGISVFSGMDPASEQDLVRHADAAMYQAKQRGKSRFAFHGQAVESPVQARALDVSGGQPAPG
jgi:diguanylate cyclase (GGDEF)-like protein